jgi:hypothetical protein
MKAALAVPRGCSRAGLLGWGEPLLVLLAAAALFAVTLDGPPEFDELYHVLAARGWLESGVPAIAQGSYERTLLFTALMGWLFGLLGDSLVVARLPSFLASVALATGLFVWLRHRAGAAVAWVATAFLVLSPFTLDLAHFARFYALHTLLFVAAAILLYEGLRAPAPGPRIALWALAASSLAAAFYLQVTTLIGLVGLALWFLVEAALPWLLARPPAQRRLLLAGAALAAAAVAALALASGLAGELLAQFRWSAAWARGSVDELWFYHLWLVLYYPGLWALFPLLVLAAFRRHPPLTRLAAITALCALLLHSLAAQKAARYVTYALPFLYIVFALALVELWPRLMAWARAGIAPMLPQALPPPWRERAMTAGLALALLFVLGANGALPRSLLMLTGARVPPQPPAEDWPQAARLLAPRLEAAAVLVTTNELQALYHLGRADVTLSRSRLLELPDTSEFARDPRTGLPVISTPSSLARLIRCTPNGLLLTTDAHWRNATQLDDAVADLLVREALPVPLPRSLHIRAFEWRTEEAPGEDCLPLPLPGGGD